MRLALLSIVLTLLLVDAKASAPGGACGRAISAAERGHETAPGLLHAIAVVESGRRDPVSGERTPWPWTVTAEGIGTYYPTKEAAISAVQALQARGITSIDVGCMQVNLQWHPAAFRSLEEAFEPALNAAYAARFLRLLHGKFGDWAAAAAAYHSQTPALGDAYGRLVAAVWSGAPVPTLREPDGTERVLLPGGVQMRLFRTASAIGSGRVFGVLN